MMCRQPSRAIEQCYRPPLDDVEVESDTDYENDFPDRVFIKSLGGKGIHMDTNLSTATVMMLMVRVANEIGIPISTQRLSFAGKNMDDPAALLKSFGVERGSTIFLALDLTGGGKRGRGAAVKDGLPEVLTELKRHVRMHLSEVEAIDSPTVLRHRGSLLEALEGRGASMQDRFNRLSVDQLKKLAAVTPVNNNEQKYRLIRTLLFPEVTEVAKELASVAKCLENAIDELSRFMVASTFASDDAVINWESMNTMLMDVLIRKERADAQLAPRDRDVPM
jgi:hypothetical protein